MYGFSLITLNVSDSQNFRLIDLPQTSTFKIIVNGRPNDLQINIMLETEGSDNKDVYKKLDQKLKNLKLYLNLFTNYKIDIKKKFSPEVYSDKNEFDKVIHNTLDSLKESNLPNFVNSRVTQQYVILQIALDEVFRGDMFNGFPKLVNWLDDNDGKGSSRFCSVRDSCDHGILDKKRAIKKVNEIFPGEFEFEDDILKRDSQKNKDSMKNYLSEVLDHVKKIFKRDFMNTHHVQDYER